MTKSRSFWDSIVTSLVSSTLGTSTIIRRMKEGISWKYTRVLTAKYSYKLSNKVWSMFKDMKNVSFLNKELRARKTVGKLKSSTRKMKTAHRLNLKSITMTIDFASWLLALMKLMILFYTTKVVTQKVMVEERLVSNTIHERSFLRMECSRIGMMRKLKQIFHIQSLTINRSQARIKSLKYQQGLIRMLKVSNDINLNIT